MTWNVRIFISPPFQRISITNRVLSLFDCFTTYYNCMTWNFKKLISDISVHKDHNSCSYLIWPFYDLLQHYDIKCQKTHISTILVHKYHKSCSFLIWPFYSLLQPYDLKCQKTHISAISVHKYHKAFSKLIWPFYDLLQLYDLKCQKSHISAISVNKYHKSCFSLISPFNGLLQHYDLKFSENSYLRHFSAQVSQIVFLAYLTFFTTFYNCMT